MKKISILLFFALVSSSIFAQSEYSRATVKIDDKNLNELGALGIEIDHGIHVPHKTFTSDFSMEELEIIKGAGFEVEILIEDVVAYYQSPRNAEVEAELRFDDCEGDGSADDDPYDFKTPDNYVYGSMGGYLTFSEAIVELEKMSDMYPHLISPLMPIGDFVTQDGNRIFWLRMSNTPNIEVESKPEVLYTALHHAREPNSLSQMIFFMWYMLENYDSDPYVKFLVDNVELCFIPVVNPDGYIYNETINPNGGGLWRKNRHVHDNGQVVGVDLNRNYGHFWAFDDIGSSPNPNSNTYRGPSAFSEVETQAVAALCNAHKFKLALNYHTFGNLLIHPWGYNDLPTDEDDIFKAFGRQMNHENNYLMGTGTETVGYTVNGDSDDWFYGEEGTKPKIYCYTPEVGSDAIDGFWPDQSRIDLLNRSNMHMNLTLAHLALNKVALADVAPNSEINSVETLVELNSRMLGFNGGEYTLRLNSNSPFAVVNDGGKTINQTFFEEEVSGFSVSVDPETPFNEEINFEAVLDYGTFTDTVTLTRTYIGNSVEMAVLFQDQIDNDAEWATDKWRVTAEDFVSAPTAYTDSEGSDYAAFENNILQTINLINLEGVEKAELQFWAKWDIENDYDYVQLRAIRQSGDIIPLCGLYTNEGVDNQQIPGEPLYDASQLEWVKEKVSLDDFLGEQIYLEFILRSDGGVEDDGFYFDDIEVISITEGVSSSTQLDFQQSISIYPNPNPGSFKMSIQDINFSNRLDWKIFDLVGSQIAQGSVLENETNITMNGLSAGVYFIELHDSENKLKALKKLIIE